ncbi:FkbM family methyltransferase [Paenibacillus humicola]|uniref:FkbM family methyltransferase n=1 Tax=Paenibacillus humicola TaxID=3110540 RepID=UPI00237BC5E9|nr:FkbM family methyltransferase [Paenibacillus humicola]
MIHQTLDGYYCEPEQFHQFRMEILSSGGITAFLDCGANTGAFANYIRHSGYGGTMISFEPASAEFAQLSHLASRDPNWVCRQVALGAEEGVARFYLAGNSESSSLLPMLDRHLASAPESQYTGTEIVRVKRLDTVCAGLLPGEQSIYLKLDVQGNEMAVMRGARRILERTTAIEIELAFAQLYEGQMLYDEMIACLKQLGFTLFCYESNFTDPGTGEVLEVNGIFLRGLSG